MYNMRRRGGEAFGVGGGSGRVVLSVSPRASALEMWWGGRGGKGEWKGDESWEVARGGFARWREAGA